MAKDHNQAAADLARQIRARQRAATSSGRRLAADVQGHYGDSTVSVTSTGTGAQVQITGPDAAEQRATVHRRAVRALRKGQ